MYHIYIISCKRGSGNPEIGGLYTEYDQAIVAYYDILSLNGRISRDKDYFFWDIYKFPSNVSFILDGESWSDTKIQKSSKYRIEFKNGREIIDEYTRITRNKRIESIIDANE
jgi:hypothetical protein